MTAHWSPTPSSIAATHTGRLMRRRSLDYEALQAWSYDDPEGYWSTVFEGLGLTFETPPRAVLGADGEWLPGARLNIVASCFEGRDGGADALIEGRDDARRRWTLDGLRRDSAAVAAGLLAAGFGPGDAIAIDLPMNAESVQIYLGIVWIGGVVVSVADSFAPEAIATRLRISEAKGIFTQGFVQRGDRRLPLYEKVCAADAPQAIVLEPQGLELRDGDIPWDEFLPQGASEPPFHIGAVSDPINILFSSGTTGDPKAIPWTQLTPIKAAGDGWAHHDIQAGEVVAWPTNLGWMMGPWLIFASLLNGASIALFDGIPTGREFTEFVADARVAMLGVVPSLVSAWRRAGALDGVDWSGIRRFSSTGEASSPDDMAWLMAKAGGKPVIEYCGGTEIGGGYLCGSMVQPQRAGQFSTVAMGARMFLLDADGQPATAGEVALASPMLGASQRLLNRDHHEVYFAGMPRGPNGEALRRHGDQIQALEGGFFRAHGRVDDTMNLGGIKVSSVEIERCVLELPSLRECAAIAVSPRDGGPSELVVVVVGDQDLDADALRAQAQKLLRSRLNPLFKIARLVARPALPRTASGKVMRRVLRDELQA